ncbi:MAG: hypothetical protein IIB81_02260, partial [Nanoarchaeota archaeon]|nr:hypothetical protein [Nanoarchaeota archaeon]
TQKSTLSLEGLGDKEIRLQSFVTVLEVVHNLKKEVRLYDIEKIVTSRTLPNIVLPNETSDISEVETEEKDLTSLYIAILLLSIGGFIWWRINKKP